MSFSSKQNIEKVKCDIHTSKYSLFLNWIGVFFPEQYVVYLVDHRACLPLQSNVETETETETETILSSWWIDDDSLSRERKN
jgi:hypothetical protein